MRAFLFCIIFFSTSIYASASYKRLDFIQVIEQADLIAEAEIISINDEFFTIKLLFILKGNRNLKIVDVKKFKDWTCAYRYSKYEIGQKELIALHKEKNSDSWLTVGFGNEGELQIDSGQILFERLLFSKSEDSWKPQLYKRVDVFNGILHYIQNIKKFNELISNGKILKVYPENKFKNAIVETIIWKNYKKLDGSKRFNRLYSD